MVLLYGRHYADRYKAVADLIPSGASVVDVCCGPGVLYHRYLKQRGIEYTGLDISPEFVRSLRARGANALLWDGGSDKPLPPADIVVMQGSLFQFLPDADRAVNRMLDSARDRVIVAEPVRNLASSSSRLLAILGRRFTATQNGEHAARFDAASLEQFFSLYGDRVVGRFTIPGGREMVYVLQGRGKSQQASA